MRRLGLRGVALGYLAIVLLGPLAMIFWKTFEHGFGPFWDSVTTPETLTAFKNTLLITAIAVPLNTVFGIVCALAIVRRRFPGKGVVNAFIDLPLAVSPVVVGVSLFLLYGRGGWFTAVQRSRDRDPVRCRRGGRDDVRLTAVRRAPGGADAAEVGEGGSRPPTRSARRAGRHSGGSRSPRSAGP
jgi:ABC-type amino acid transport system permease subunit